MGDEVWFKQDVEGKGTVIEITEKYDRWMGRTVREFVLANKARDCSPWHPMVRYSPVHKCNVIYANGDSIF
jgi:hypothetical protein